jgi:hypothetical protein
MHDAVHVEHENVVVVEHESGASVVEVGECLARADAGEVRGRFFDQRNRLLARFHAVELEGADDVEHA